MTPIRRMIIGGYMIAAGLLLGGAAMATPVVAVPTPSVASPQPLGTTVTISYSATDTDPGTISYRVQVGIVGSSALSMLRDFSVANSFVFTPELHSGNYRFVITARNNTTLSTGSNAIASYKFMALVTAGVPVLTPTANPLVALLSAPPCAAGVVSMRASILRSGAAVPFDTSWVSCIAKQDVNILIAGMRPSTGYTITPQTTNGTTVTNGTALSHTTGPASVSLAGATVVVPQTSADSGPERFLLMSLTAPNIPEALDNSGTPVWYYVDPSGATPTVTRPVPGGNILMYANGANSAGSAVVNQQVLREIDLAGNIIHETNATRVSEQVVALSGVASSCFLGGTDCLVGAFHHEATRLANGHTLVLTDEEKIFTDGTQGSSPTNPVDIIGDIIVDLDTNWQVSWYWRTFDHLNANRAAILGETCVNNQPGCTPVILTAGIAQDWLHSNALQYSPADGSILLSMRHQDWIDKIDYGNGTGTSAVLWTLGLGGNFTFNSSDPYPWFSHQHDPGFVQNGTTTLAMFDNGNTRVAPPPLGLGQPQGTPEGDSRGYVLNVDQVNMMVTPMVMADIGFFSEALGTAELLTNGDYHFDAGFADVTPSYSQAIEVFPDAALGFTLEMNNVKSYRTIRMNSLYTEPPKD
jgi:Arylsulfotransferase (ASST)